MATAVTLSGSRRGGHTCAVYRVSRDGYNDNVTDVSLYVLLYFKVSKAEK